MARHQNAPTKQCVFRFSYNATPVVGVTIELINAAASGYEIELRNMRWNSLLANTITITRTSAAATGGTSAGGTPTRSRTDNAPIGTIKTYTVAPTPGAASGIWDVIDHAAATDRSELSREFPLTGLVIAPGEACSVTFTVATATKGFLEWIENTIT